MKKHGPVVLLVVSCALAALAVFQSFRFSHSEQASRAMLAALEREAGHVVASLTELRRAQAGYVAIGQGPEFWMRRAGELAGDVERGLARLRSMTSDPAAERHLGEASTALTDLLQLDGRARTALEGNQSFFASDIIYAESVMPAQRIGESVTAARDAEVGAIDDVLNRERLVSLAIGPATLLLVLLSAWFAGASRARRPALSKNEEVAQMLRELPPAVKKPGVPAGTTPPVATPPRATAAPAAAPRITPAVEQAVAPPPPPPRPAVDVAEVAELCVDLARVLEAADLPRLLERSARTLGASGLIVWVVDSEGTRLVPALAHGYPERVLTRLGTLEVDAENVTSQAYRSLRPQSVAGGNRENAASAVAVPLVTTAGCNGVLAVEVPGSKPAPECVASARILAAQLATLLSPVDLPASDASTPSGQRAAEA